MRVQGSGDNLMAAAENRSRLKWTLEGREMVGVERMQPKSEGCWWLVSALEQLLFSESSLVFECVFWQHARQQPCFAAHTDVSRAAAESPR